jgi:hypothetical protein
MSEDMIPVGLRPVQNRDVILLVEATGPVEGRTTANVSMVQPAEERIVTTVSAEGANRGVEGDEPNALALFSSSIAH